MEVYMEQISDLIPNGSDEQEKLQNTPMVFKKKSSTNNANMKEGLSIKEDKQTGIFVQGLKQIVSNLNKI